MLINKFPLFRTRNIEHLPINTPVNLLLIQIGLNGRTILEGIVVDFPIKINNVITKVAQRARLVGAHDRVRRHSALNKGTLITLD